MSGHSKWAQIKRKKGVADVKRGEVFSKIARMIIVAARGGDKNPELNHKLKTAIEKARAVNMPKDVIERAIAKAAGTEGAMEEFIYEAYGPEGAAMLIEGITDSKNRSTQEIKHLLSEYGGKLANPGTVQWMFEKKTAIEIPKAKNLLTSDEIELLAIDAGAESLENTAEAVIVWVLPVNAQKITEFLNKHAITVAEVFTVYVPQNTISVSSAAGQILAKLTEVLEARDDVQNVYTNISD